MSNKLYGLVVRPPIFPPPTLAPYLPLTGPIAYLIRFFRFSYSLTVAWPFIVVGFIADGYLKTGIMPKPEGRSTQAAIILSVVNSLIWSITYGLPPSASKAMSGPSPASPSSTTPLLSSLPEPLNKPPPRLTTWLLTGPDGHGRSIKSSPVIIEPAREADCLGVMKDGFGRVRKGKVGGDWLWVEGEGRKMTQGAGRADEPAKQGERVILYFVGGGYVSGTPLLGPQCYSLLRSSQHPQPTRLLALTYRLAISHDQAFPAALQDALAAYSYLVRDLGFRPKDICITGDSAGGGLTWSLLAYLGVLLEKDKEGGGKSGLGLPGRVGLFSPWLDLTGSHPSVSKNKHLDVLNHGQMIGASRFYLLNLPHHHHRHSYLPSFPIQDNAALLSRFPTVKDLMSEEAFEALGNHHPLFSPSAMALIETKRGQKPLEFVEAFDYDDDDEANEGNGSPPTGSRTSSAQSSSSNIKQPGSRSPSPSSSDPFVPLTSLFLAPLASHSKPPRFFCHHGSVELFADEIVHFESLLRSNGLQCDSYTEKGGFHCISGIFPPLLEESGGPNAKSEGLAGTMRRYLGVGKAEARASKAWKGWWEGGGSREAGGEGWWY